MPAEARAVVPHPHEGRLQLSSQELGLTVERLSVVTGGAQRSHQER